MKTNTVAIIGPILSFAFKFLSLAIRQPRHMVDYRHHFAFIILNECHLRAIDFEEEICFRFGIKIQSTSQCVSSKKLARLNDLHFAE